MLLIQIVNVGFCIGDHPRETYTHTSTPRRTLSQGPALHTRDTHETHTTLLAPLKRPAHKPCMHTNNRHSQERAAVTMCSAFKIGKRVLAVRVAARVFMWQGRQVPQVAQKAISQCSSSFSCLCPSALMLVVLKVSCVARGGNCCQEKSTRPERMQCNFRFSFDHFYHLPVLRGCLPAKVLTRPETRNLPRL